MALEGTVLYTVGGFGWIHARAPGLGTILQRCKAATCASLRKTLRQERVETLLSAEQSALLSQEQALGHRRAVLEEEGDTVVLQALEQIAARATAFLGPIRRGASRRPLFLRPSRPPSLSSSKSSGSAKQRLCF